MQEDHQLCFKCNSELPHTGFASHSDNPIEKIFWGRLNLDAATSEFYFTKGNIIQTLIHELKYKSNKEIGIYFGRVMGESILSSGRFNNIEALVPLPLFAHKEKRRGYNQSYIICQGMAAVMNLPVISGNVIRRRSTETQTTKKRKERWENVEGSFSVRNPDELVNKHLLLVDDVLTTGATLEACGSEMLKVQGVTLSIAALAYATH